MIIAVEPEVGMLSDVGGVVASVQGPDMVNDGEQHVLVIPVPLLRVPAPGDEGGHVDDLGEVHPRRDLLVKSCRVFKPFQMERGNNRQFLQCQLLGALLVPVTVRAADLGHAAEMLGLSESLETVLETDGVCDGGEVKGDVPKRVDGGGDPLADLAHHVTL